MWQKQTFMHKIAKINNFSNFASQCPKSHTELFYYAMLAALHMYLFINFLCQFQVEDILRSMYRGLQKLAVGLEQVVLDQAFHGGSFYQHFHEAEFQLKYVSHTHSRFIIIILIT